METSEISQSQIQIYTCIQCTNVALVTLKTIFPPNNDRIQRLCYYHLKSQIELEKIKKDEFMETHKIKKSRKTIPIKEYDSRPISELTPIEQKRLKYIIDNKLNVPLDKLESIIKDEEL